MKTKIEVFDEESGKELLPLNLPNNYEPNEGEIIETNKGKYEIIRIIKNNYESTVVRITIEVKKI